MIAVVSTYVLLFKEMPTIFQVTTVLLFHTCWTNEPIRIPMVIMEIIDQFENTNRCHILFLVEDDFLPDFFHGRISVRINIQAGSLLTRMTHMNNKQNDHDPFYNDILLSSFFDNSRVLLAEPVEKTVYSIITRLVLMVSRTNHLVQQQRKSTITLILTILAS